MTEENKEVVEETTEENVEQTTNEIDESKFESAGDDSIVKIDLSKPPPTQENEETDEEPVEEEKVDVVEEPESKEEIVEETEDQPTIQEVTEEEEAEVEEIKEEIEEAVAEAEATGEPLPENIQKLIEFMDDTGGDLNDYVQLNRDISKMDDSEVLDEYYRATKSHLSPEERNFLLEDTFGYDEEIDDTKTIRKKKIALKEQVAEARAHLDRQKSKYYNEIKAGSRLTQDQQQAVNFYNTYQKENEAQKKKTEASHKTFLKKTDNVFNNKFKGFDYEVGDKKFRFNVKDVDQVKATQSDINNFLNQFVDEDTATVKDAAAYHKSIFTAMNADAIAKHFYEQGRADAIKGQIAKDKNINTSARQTHGEVETGGVKFKVLGDSADDFKFKIRKKK